MKISVSLATLALLAGAPNIAPADPGAIPEAATVRAETTARRVVRDKESGELRAPTDDEQKAMRDSSPAARTNKQPLELRRHPDGMRSAVPGPAKLVTLRAQRQADGSVTIKHDDPTNERGVDRAAQRPTE